jgi:hypothetical protein
MSTSQSIEAPPGHNPTGANCAISIRDRARVFRIETGEIRGGKLMPTAYVYFRKGRHLADFNVYGKIYHPFWSHIPEDRVFDIEFPWVGLKALFGLYEGPDIHFSRDLAKIYGSDVLIPYLGHRTGNWVTLPAPADPRIPGQPAITFRFNQRMVNIIQRFIETKEFSYD